MKKFTSLKGLVLGLVVLATTPTFGQAVQQTTSQESAIVENQPLLINLNGIDYINADALKHAGFYVHPNTSRGKISDFEYLIEDGHSCIEVSVNHNYAVSSSSITELTRAPFELNGTLYVPECIETILNIRLSVDEYGIIVESEKMGEYTILEDGTVLRADYNFVPFSVLQS